MTIPKVEKQLKEWIRSHHLICVGTDFVFETIDQTQLDRFENCLEALGVQYWANKGSPNTRFSEISD
ncbi:MAG: hypothetical protein EBR69_01235 [Synechococcaceae bacterium WB4_2_0805]|nr:hypothetical protein [Synechococcaceae bacterium WB4_2_0805]